MEEDFYPALGEKFPEVEVTTTKGKMKLPEAFRGKWWILFSHPADFTPVCTTEFVAFQRRYQEFRELGCELIGLSVDQVFSHIQWLKWIEKNLGVKVEFPVIADDLGELAGLLGMLHPGKGTNTVRAVFVVDPQGVIRAILYYPQEIGRNVSEILRVVKALKTADEKGVATPHNWPENELIGAGLILPPATSEEEAVQREKAAQEGKHSCYDWWFCYTKE